MPDHAPTARPKQRPALPVAPAIATALGLLTAALAAGVDQSAPAWLWLRPVALLGASAMPARLALEAAAYCVDRDGRPARRAVRLPHGIGSGRQAPAASIHSFGRVHLPGRDALPTGGAHT